MFLTTNRPDTIDPAFESRIDLILEYPDLDHAARYAVWKNFLDNIPQKQMKLTDEDVHELAKTESNGREIKSAVKLGQILAQRRNEALDVGILHMVLGLKQQGRNKKRKGNQDG
jgi:SpoVK/Ycf46/Vps4 family AAA+-type ATPase